MKSLIKFAMGAAIAGALVNLLLKQRSARRAGIPTLFEEGVPRGTTGFTVGELVADAEGNVAGQPREWGGGQSGLNS